MGLQKTLTFSIALLLCAAACEHDKPAKAATTAFWQPVARAVCDELRKAVDLAIVEHDEKASIVAIDASYYGRFEKSTRNMEIGIRRFISVRRAAEIEDAFAALKRSIKAKSPSQIIQQKLATLESMLRLDGKRLDQIGVRPAHFKIGR